MPTEKGVQMASAIRAVLEMQSDCIRLFHDLDKTLSDLHPLLGNLVTSWVGTSINSQQLYVAQYLFRIYAPHGKKDRILGVNVCFHDQPKRLFPEPIFVVANTSYIPEPPTREEELTRAFDPWSAYLDWAQDKSFGRALEVEPFRPTIQKIVIAAEPLFSITSLDAALHTIGLVGRPSGSH